MKKFIFIISVLCLTTMIAQSGIISDSTSCFIIRVIDVETNRGIPLAELKTTSKISYFTDSHGIICFDEPSLMNQRVYFEIFSHGYQNRQGVVLNTIPGISDTIRIKRLNIAKRLYRITGQDIYGESVKAGLPVPILRQGLNGKVTGQDTFIETYYRGKIYWFWGDTWGPASFNERASGATSELPENGGLNPGIGIDLNYFVDSTGLNKSMCDIPGPGLVWIDWLANLPDQNGTERLFAKYTRTKNLSVAYERGIAVFDDSLFVFKSVNQIDEWLDKVHSSGHPVKIHSENQQYLYIFDRYGLERVAAESIKIPDPGNYERFTCLKSGSRFSEAKIDRDDNKNIVYSWKVNTDPISTRQQYQLMDSCLLLENEGWFNPMDILTGERLVLNPASVYWNEYRKRWIMIAHVFGGQVWFLEADTPTGPWVYARKIVSHKNYGFYNVGQHPLFDQDNGRVIYFEGTYTVGFTGNPDPTPLYDYNQMMYMLTLDDERLSLPVPVYYSDSDVDGLSYLTRDSVESLKLWESVKEVPFFALPAYQKLENSIPVYHEQVNGKYRLLIDSHKGEKSTGIPLFYALPNVLNKEQEIDGTWECEADGYGFSMDLQLKGDEVYAIPDDPSLLFIDGIVLEDSIRLIMRGSIEKETYILTFQAFNGILNGRIVATGNNDAGIVNGQKQKNVFSELFSSRATVPLYEYQTSDGAYVYSTDVSLPGMKRSEKPLCRVWRNPTSILALDHTARPIPLKE